MRTLSAVGLVTLLWLTVVTQVGAQTLWVIPGSGDWYLAANWSTTVPTAVDNVTIDNGGIAVADRSSPSFTTDPATSGLDIGLRLDPAIGPPFATGALELVDVDLSVGADLNVGVVNTSAGLFNDATGMLSSVAGGSANGDVSAGRVGVGEYSNGTAGALATGAMNLSGSLSGNNVDALFIGRSTASGTADGTVSVASDISSFRRVAVGQTSLLSTGDATGDLTTGGAVATTETPFTSFDVGVQAGDGTANGTAQIANGIGGFVNVSIGSGSTDGAPGAGGTGLLDLLAGGVSAIEGFQLIVGTTNGDGNVLGTANINGGIDRFLFVETGVIRANGAAGNAIGLIDVTGGGIVGRTGGGLTVGQSDGSGNADGILGVVGSIDDFRRVTVGLTGLLSTGDATGDLTTGGAVTADGSPATAFTIGMQAGDGAASGSARVADGIDGFSSVLVGSGSTDGAPGASATGLLNVLAGGVSTIDGSFLGIGTTNGDGNLQGTANVAGSISGFGTVQAGVVGDASAAGNATGQLNVTGGNISGTATNNLTIGQALGNGIATGTVSVDGSVSDFRQIEVGQTGLLSTGNGIGQLTVGGMATATESSLTDFGVGSQAGDGAANGSAQIAGGIAGYTNVSVGSGSADGAPGASGVGLIDVLAGGISATDGFLLAVGATNGAGNLQGTLNVTGGIERFRFVQAGVVRGPGADGNATGVLNITSGGLVGISISELVVGQTGGPGNADGSVQIVGDLSGFEPLIVGRTEPGSSGTASGSLGLESGMATATSLAVGIAEGLGAAQGTIELDQTLVELSEDLTLGSGSRLILHLDGLIRGLEYSALDASTAMLDGALDVLFEFQPPGGAHEFDLIRADDSAGAIIGDFDPGGVTITGLPPTYNVVTAIVTDLINGQPTAIYRLTVTSAGVEVVDVPTLGASSLLGLALLMVVLGLRTLRRSSTRPSKPTTAK